MDVNFYDLGYQGVEVSLRDSNREETAMVEKVFKKQILKLWQLQQGKGILRINSLFIGDEILRKNV